jgi:hypothetical protein
MKRATATMVLCLAALPAAAQAPAIGRLFTTPSEREQLDRMRQRGGNADLTAEARTPQRPPAPAMAPPAPPPPVTVTGVVRRSNGAATVWVDGEARPAGAQGHVVRTPDGRTITVRPGQQYDPATGSVSDVPGR